MNTIFKYIKPMIIFFSSIIIVPLFLTILNLLKLETNKTIIITITSIIMFIIGIILGKNSNNKGYLKGILFSTICILMLIIISLLFKFSLNINSLIYYIILIIATTFGSMLGINKKSKN